MQPTFPPGAAEATEGSSDRHHPKKARSRHAAPIARITAEAKGNVEVSAAASILKNSATRVAQGRSELLLEIMGNPRWLGEQSNRDLNTGRAAAVIKLAAEKSGWGRQMPPGRALGLAFAFSHLGHVAEVADVEVDANRRITIHGMTVVAPA